MSAGAASGALRPGEGKAVKSLWVFVSGFFFAVMGVFVKQGSEYFSSAELVFYRSLLGLIITSFTMQAAGISFRTSELQRHVTRGTLGCLGLILYFYTITILPLAMAVTLNHTAPIFFGAMAFLAASERPNRLAALGMLIGFCGVVLLLRPSAESLQLWGCSVGLVVGFLVAVGYMYIRRLGEAGEPEARTVFYYTLICTLCAGLWMAFTGVHPVTLENVWILLAVGVSATVAQLALTRAYRGGRSILTTTLTYTNVVFAAVFGVLIWGEVLPLVSWVAFLLIILSGILSTLGTIPKRQAA